MPICIRIKNELSCPVVICDMCGYEIEDTEDGNYEWLADDEGKPDAPIYFTHKRCSFAFKKKMDQGFLMNGELGLFVFYLGNNTRYDAKKAKQSAAISALI